MAEPAPVLVFDSGIGGLTVAREIRRLMPGLPLVYAADDAGFPYGAWQAEALTRHCTGVVTRLAGALRPAAVVIACNTASTLVLPPLRAALDIPIVGTVPAIKPAAERTRSGLVSVLATPGTVTRDYTFDLIHRFAPDVAVTLVGARRLAGLAEEALLRGRLDADLLAAELAPCFVEKGGRRTDVVVLACTHFPLLAERMAEIAPWPVDWLDPAPAIARRLRDVLLASGATTGEGLLAAPVRMLATSGADLSAALALLSGQTPAFSGAEAASSV